VDSVGDLEEGESVSAGDSDEDELGSRGDSEEHETDPRVKEEVGSRNLHGSLQCEICDFLVIVVEDPTVGMNIGLLLYGVLFYLQLPTDRVAMLVCE